MSPISFFHLLDLISIIYITVAVLPEIGEDNAGVRVHSG